MAGESEEAGALPVSHEAELQEHSKAVNCVALDRAGARVATASSDYGVRLFDFAGMDRRMNCFKHLQPFDSHSVMSLRFNCTGEGMLAVASSSQPKVLDRDGKPYGSFPTGDMYLRDMKNTKGHVMNCTGGVFHPSERSVCLTCSGDGTLRLWDVTRCDHPSGPQTAVIKPQLRKPGRFAVTACDFNADGSLAAGAVSDGSIQLFSTKSNGFHSAAIGQVLPPKAQMVRQNSWSVSTKCQRFATNAHSEEVTSVRFAKTGEAPLLLSRSMDGTLRVWDSRKLSTCLASFSDLPCTHETTECEMSPKETVILTGVTPDRDDSEQGRIECFSAKDFLHLQTLNVGDGSGVATLKWHPHINQIVYGGGSKNSGDVRVLYSPEGSKRGALLCASRKEREANKELKEFAGVNINNAVRTPQHIRELGDPNARSDATLTGKHGESPRKDPQLSHKPQPPSYGRGTGGQVGATTTTLLTQKLMADKGAKTKIQDQDPRQELLKHAGSASQDPRFTGVYKETDPKRVLDNRTTEQIAKEEAQATGKRRRADLETYKDEVDDE